MVINVVNLEPVVHWFDYRCDSSVQSAHSNFWYENRRLGVDLIESLVFYWHAFYIHLISYPLWYGVDQLYCCCFLSARKNVRQVRKWLWKKPFVWYLSNKWRVKRKHCHSWRPELVPNDLMLCFLSMIMATGLNPIDLRSRAVLCCSICF